MAEVPVSRSLRAGRADKLKHLLPDQEGVLDDAEEEAHPDEEVVESVEVEPAALGDSLWLAQAKPTTTDDSAAVSGVSESSGGGGASPSSGGSGWGGLLALGALALAAGGGGGSSGKREGADPPSPEADNIPPSVLITDNRPGTTNQPITYTFTFSEPVTGFTAEDVVVTNGAKGAFTAVSATVYTLVVTPTAGFEGNVTVDVAAGVATDAAGNGNTAAAQSVQAVDTLAPAFVRLEAHSNGGTAPGTLELVYNEPMASTNLPSAAAFVVTVNGVSHTPTSVSADGVKIVLTFAPGVIVAGNLSLTIAYVDPTAADDPVAIQDAAGNDAPSVNLSSGVVADGYIRGAQMYLDGPNGLIELTGVVTDDFGNFFLPAGANPNGYALVAVGGVNIDTGLPNLAPLKAPAGSTTINPLTTLVQALIEGAQQQGQTITPELAAANVATALGLTLPAGQSLTTFDPLSATGTEAVAAQQAAAQIATVITLVAAEAGTQAAQAASTQVLSNLATVVTATVSAAAQNDSQSINTVSLSDASVLAQALSGVVLSEAAQSTLVEANTAIASATSLASISVAQSQFLDKIAPAAPTSLSVVPVTNTATPTVTVQLNVTSTDGSAVVVGDTVVLFDGTVEVARKVLTLSDLSAGRVDLQPVAPLAEGLRQLSAQVIDQAGNIGALSAVRATTIDLSGPQATLVAATDNLAVGASTTLTVTFNEAVTGLALEDFEVTGGGVLSALSGPQSLGTQQVYTLTYTAPAQGAAGTVSLKAGSYTDAAGNLGASSNSLNLAAINPPALSITAAGGADRVISTQAGDNVIQGKAQASNGPVTLSFDSTVLASDIAVDANGLWSYTLTANDLITLGQGSGKTLTVSQTRTVGGTDYTGSATTTVGVDTTAPGQPAINSVAGDNLINAAERTAGVAISGTAEAGSRLELAVGAAVRVVSVDGSGNWSYTLTPADYNALGAMTGGPSVTAVAVDAAGNRSSAATQSFAIDTVAPTLGLVRLSTSTDTGTQGDGRTNNPLPSIEFTAEVGSTLSLALRSGPTGDFTPVAGISATGTGSLQTLALGDANLADGSYTVRLTAVDAAGNASVRDATVVIDGTAPLFSSGSAASPVAENSATGQLVYTARTSDASLVVYSLKPGADAASFAINPSTGAVTLLVSPDFETQASYSFTVVATDAAGNAGEQAVTLSVTDLNDNAPVFTSGASGSVAENAPLSTVIYQAATTDADGTQANRAVVYSLKPGTGDFDALTIDSATGAVTLKASADFETKATYTFTVVATNTGLNNTTFVSEQAVSVSVIDVNEAPTAVQLTPTLTSLPEDSVFQSRLKVADIQITDDALGTNTFALSGADAALFEVFEGALYLKAGAALDYETKPQLAVTVSVKDETIVGSSAVSSSLTITVTDVNEAPTAVGAVGAQTAVTGQAFSLNIQGNFADQDAGANGTLTYSATGLPAGLSINASTGVISGTASADRAPAQVTVTATDGGGLFVTQSFNLGVVSAPAISSIAANKAAVKSGDAVVFTATLSEAVTVNTSNGTPTLTLQVGAQTLTATYSGGSGTTSLTFTATAGAGDDSTVTVTAINLNGGTITGNTTAQGLLTSTTGQVVANFVVDNTAPALPVITSITDNSGSTSDNLTNDNTPVLTVSAEAGITVGLGSNGQPLDASWYQVQENPAGTYTITVVKPDGLPDGNYGVFARDAAGNVTAPTAPGTATFRIDTLAPTVVITDNRDGTTNQPITYTFTFSEPVTGFTAEDVVVANGAKGAFTAVSATVYTLVVTPNADFEGNVTVDVAAGVATDAAGNGNTASAQSVQAVDTLAPALPVITSITDNSGSTSDNLTNDNTPVLTVSAEAGITVGLGSNGQPLDASWYQVQENPAGTYTITVVKPDGLPDGNYGVFARDAAGNVTAPTAPGTATFRIDTLDNTVTFEVLVTENTISFQGTATGDITIQLDATGNAIFVREGVVANHIVTAFGDKWIDLAASNDNGANIHLVLNGTAADDTFKINVPAVGQLVVTGDGGAGQDQLVVRVPDPVPGFDDTILTLITDQLASVETLFFQFDLTALNTTSPFDNDKLTLTSDSRIDTEITLIKVQYGALDLSQVPSLPTVELQFF
jgi:hypothetical protein